MSPLPENLAEVGSIHISVLLEEDGTSTAFVISDLSNTEAIGHLTVALDRLRNDVVSKWSNNEEPDEELECPNCGEPFFQHEPEDEDGE